MSEDESVYPNEPTKSPSAGAYRLSARRELEQMIRRHEGLVAGWKALLAALPPDLPEEAEAALWELLTRARGRAWF